MKFKIFFDEAWRWPLAWPVVVWWIVQLDVFDTSILGDSKKFTEKKRTEIFNEIKNFEINEKLIFWFWFASNKEIDQLWIVWWINLATKRTIIVIINKYINNRIKKFEKNLFNTEWDKFLTYQEIKYIIKNYLENWKIDYKNLISKFNKFEKIYWLIFDWNTDFWLSKDLWFKIITLVKWDAKNALIWWASIVAKVTRDNRMINISKKYPDYKFEKHKWYWTVLHRKIITEKWICEIHRKSFTKNFIN